MTWANQKILGVGIAFISVVALTGCGKGSQNTGDSSGGSSAPAPTDQTQNRMSAFDVNQFPLNKLVCDPMGGETTDPNAGLKASLFYLKAGQSHYSNVMDYIQNGIHSEQFLFYSSVNIPTRLFDKGFPTETGGIVKDDAGSNLVEYFALQFKSNLRLDPSQDSEGLYQLAILSDDGAILNEVNVDGTSSLLINNDGDHPTRMGCGQNALDMKFGVSHKIELNYYQGPRYHIAAVVMWRKVASASDALDNSCGLTGNETFFDYNNNSAPQPAYNALLARGWKPLSKANYSLQDVSTFNPCVRGQVPVITNFAVAEVTVGSVRLTWTTDIPSTSQARVVDVVAGTETLTSSDNLLRTSHSVVVSSLAIGVNYMVQGVSISDTYGKALSNGISFQVQP